MKSCRWLLPALFTLPALGVVARADYPKIAGSDERVASLLPLPPGPVPSPRIAASSVTAERVWVKVRVSAPLATLASELNLTGARLALLNDVDEDHQFTRGDWLVIPAQAIREARRSVALDTTEARRSVPLVEPPAPDLEVSTPSTRDNDNWVRTAQRLGPTIQEILRQTPGQETARLVAGQPGQLAQAGAGRPQMILGVRPVGSGGLSWPDSPDFGGETLPADQDQGAWIWPTSGQFSSGFGWRWGRMHNGIDIANAVGTRILAARSGQVVFSGWDDGGYGYKIDIRHSDGSISRYAHNSRLLVRVGDEVAQGAPISLMGSTGRSTGPHLHFEIRMPGRGALNPLQFLPAKA